MGVPAKCDIFHKVKLNLCPGQKILNDTKIIFGGLSVQERVFACGAVKLIKQMNVIGEPVATQKLLILPSSSADMMDMGLYTLISPAAM